jgi:hypothetical protein
MADPNLKAAMENVDRDMAEVIAPEISRFAPKRSGTLQALHAEGRQLSERHKREWDEWAGKLKAWTEEHLRNVG